MNLIDYWNKSQTKYLSLTKPSQYAVIVESKLHTKSRILDIGGARGNDSMYFLSKGHIPTIIDISTVAKDELIKNTKNISFIARDLKSIPYPFEDKSFDVIYSRLTLQYFTPDEIVQILKEIKRLLRINGKGYISVKSIRDENEMQSLKKNGKELSKGVFIVEGVTKSRYSNDQFKEFISEAGFTKFEINEISEELGELNKHGHSKLLLTELIVFNR